MKLHGLGSDFAYMIEQDSLSMHDGQDGERALLPEVERWCRETLRSHRLENRYCAIDMVDDQGKVTVISEGVLLSFLVFENQADMLLFRLRWLDRD